MTWDLRSNTQNSVNPPEVSELGAWEKVAEQKSFQNLGPPTKTYQISMH